MLVGIDKDLGRIYLPILDKMISRAGAPVKRAVEGEFGIVVAKQRRPRVLDMVERNGVLLPIIGGYDTLWASISLNERVDAGAQYQAQQAFAGGGSPAAPSATVYFNVIACATTGFTTKTKTDQSIGSSSSGATTNEITGSGLARATATSPVGGDYTAPSTLGGTFSQVVKKTFTASGSVTAHGAAVFNSTTVAGSILYVEDQFSSDATLVNGDTLTVTWTISN